MPSTNSFDADLLAIQTIWKSEQMVRVACEVGLEPNSMIENLPAEDTRRGIPFLESIT